MLKMGWYKTHLIIMSLFEKYPIIQNPWHGIPYKTLNTKLHSAHKAQVNVYGY